MPKMKTTAEKRVRWRAAWAEGWDGMADVEDAPLWLLATLDDIDTLLAERKSLLAENERLKAEIEGWRIGVQVAQDILDTRPR